MINIILKLTEFIIWTLKNNSKNNTLTYLTEKYLHLMDNIQYTYNGQPDRKTKTYFVLDIIIICATYQKINLVDKITLCTT